MSLCAISFFNGIDLYTITRVWGSQKKHIPHSEEVCDSYVPVCRFNYDYCYILLALDPPSLKTSLFYSIFILGWQCLYVPNKCNQNCYLMKRDDMLFSRFPVKLKMSFLKNTPLLSIQNYSFIILFY